MPHQLLPASQFHLLLRDVVKTALFNGFFMEEIIIISLQSSPVLTVELTLPVLFLNKRLLVLHMPSIVACFSVIFPSKKHLQTIFCCTFSIGKVSIMHKVEDSKRKKGH